MDSSFPGDPRLEQAAQAARQAPAAEFPPEDDDSSLATRQSLLTRLRDWDDQEGWREFFNTYWRLIYNVARKAGLPEAEAQDIVQETLLSIAKKMPGFQYDPAQGSFKNWLLLNVRSRITDHWRRKSARPEFQALPDSMGESSVMTDPAATRPADLDLLWQKEWEENLLKMALDRTKARVSARQYLIFDLATFKEVPLSKITSTLGVNVAQVYLAKHRVGKVLKEEVTRINRMTSEPQ